MNLKNIMLVKEVRQKRSHIMIPFIWYIQDKQIHWDRNELGLVEVGNDVWLLYVCGVILQDGKIIFECKKRC